MERTPRAGCERGRRHGQCHRAPHWASLGAAGCRAAWQAMPRANRAFGVTHDTQSCQCSSNVLKHGHSSELTPGQGRSSCTSLTRHIPLGLCITSNVPYPRKKSVIYGTFKINAHLVFLLIPNHPRTRAAAGAVLGPARTAAPAALLSLPPWQPCCQGQIPKNMDFQQHCQHLCLTSTNSCLVPGGSVPSRRARWTQMSHLTDKPFQSWGPSCFLMGSSFLSTTPECMRLN